MNQSQSKHVKETHIQRWTAAQWLSAFRNRFSASVVTSQALILTAQMSHVLHETQNVLGAWCECGLSDKVPGRHGPRGEHLAIDMMWFAPNGSDWDAPLVALEHESNHSKAGTHKDCWRVFQVAAPLRIFIGYTSTKKTQVRCVDELRRMRDPNQGGGRFHMLPGGEDIVLIGHYQMSDFTDWKGTIWTMDKMYSLDEFVAQL